MGLGAAVFIIGIIYLMIMYPGSGRWRSGFMIVFVIVAVIGEPCTKADRA
jgi:hypothetical protein